MRSRFSRLRSFLAAFRAANLVTLTLTVIHVAYAVAIIVFTVLAILMPQQRAHDAFTVIWLSAYPVALVAGGLRWQNLRAWQLGIIVVYGVAFALAGMWASKAPDSLTTGADTDAAVALSALMCVVVVISSETVAVVLRKRNPAANAGEGTR
jgi:hypothetical protein